MRGGPPEKQALGQLLHVFEDGASGRREAGNAFKPGIDDRERTAPQHIGQHSEYKREDPGQEDDHIPVPEGDRRAFPHENKGEYADDERDREADQQGRQRAVMPVPKRDQDGQKHEQCTDQQRIAHVARYDVNVHYCVEAGPVTTLPPTVFKRNLTSFGPSMMFDGML